MNSLESFLLSLNGSSYPPLLIVEPTADGKHLIKIIKIKPPSETPQEATESAATEIGAVAPGVDITSEKVDEIAKPAIRPSDVSSSTEMISSPSQTLDRMKLNQHVWNTFVFPLLSKEDKALLPSQVPILSKFTDSGELHYFIKKDTLSPSTLEELEVRLQQNHRLTLSEDSNFDLSFKIPNHHLLHLFFHKPELLQDLYNSFPQIKDMHDILINGLDIDGLTTASMGVIQKFKSESAPGDYIITKNETGYTIHYHNTQGFIRAFSYSGSFQSFSSFQGFEHLKRPFKFRDHSLGEAASMHNAFLHFKYMGIANSLKKYDSNEMCNFSVGGIDAAIDMEDLIAWHEHLPEGVAKTKIFNELLTYFSISFAHYNSLKGQALSETKKISLEGMRRPVGKAQITEAALRYLPKSQLLSKEHRQKLYQMWQRSVKYSNKSKAVISNYTGKVGNAESRFVRRNKEVLQDLANGIPVSISTGWARHTVELTLLQHKGVTYFLYTNKGSTLHQDNHTKLYRVTKPITEEMIGHLRRRPHMGQYGEKQGAYFFAPKKVLAKVKAELGGSRPQTMPEEFGLELISSIKKIPQKVGNCTIANGKEMMYNAAFLLKFVELLDGKHPLPDSIKLANQHAYHIHKEQNLQQRVYQLSIWSHFTKYLPHDTPELSKRHFELFQMISTKVVNKRSKIEKYTKLGETEGSIIPDIFRSLQETIHDLVKNCPCDIENCTGPIAFKAGNRIKRGPNGGFGIYKSKYFNSGSDEHPKFHLVMKSRTGKFEIMDIFSNTSKEEGRYRVQLDESKTASFTTLGEIAKLMEARDHQLIFAL